MDYLNFLDDEQKKAVLATNGIVRVMAGAGTGKTTTLQSRITHILKSGMASPVEIMAVTFTNKAANEIKERVQKSIGENYTSGLRMGTFHALSLRILRKYYSQSGLKSSKFNIIDDDDSLKLFSIAVEKSGAFGNYVSPDRPEEMTDKEYESLCNISKKEFDVGIKPFTRDAKNKVMRWKESGLSLQEALDTVSSRNSIQDEAFVKVYEYYQEELEIRNSCDFTDLLLRVVYLFDNYPEIAERESRKVKFLLVDEFQDTNMLQYKWLKHLSMYHGNLFVVGDVDQSLYSFRGSAPQIMERIRKECSFDISLKTNRRCTGEILAPANMLVDINKRDEPKVLISEKTGEPVKIQYAENEFSEANQIGSSIRKLIDSGVKSSEIAILVRAGHVLNPIEKALVKMGVPYTLVGGKSLMDREEVKDMIAYLKLAVDPYNDLAFQRVANKPLRGLGPAAIDYITDLASRRDLSFDEACLVASDDTATGAIRKNTREKLAEFGGFLSNIVNAYDMGVPPMSILDAAYNETGYVNWLKEKKDNFQERDSNVSFLHTYVNNFSDLSDFLQEFSLMSEDDSLDEVGVRLSTIHASKGLEFEHIFLPAWEDGIIPSARSIQETPGDIDDPWVGPPVGGCDEERRIAHVALTRAKISAVVSYAKSRGNRRTKQSRFIKESGLRGGYNRENNSDNNDFNSSVSVPLFKGIKFKKPSLKM